MYLLPLNFDALNTHLAMELETGVSFNQQATNITYLCVYKKNGDFYLFRIHGKVIVFVLICVSTSAAFSRLT